MNKVVLFCLYLGSIGFTQSFQLRTSKKNLQTPNRNALQAQAGNELKKGFNILELIPGGQGPLVSAVRETWRLEWLFLMTELAPQSKKGGYQRQSYDFTSKFPSQEFPFELNRYHLYIGNPCPWCHRVALARALRMLDDTHFTVTHLEDDPTKASRGGWILGKSVDPLFGASDLKGVYDGCSDTIKGFKGRCTAPLLVDKKTKKIVSNESKEIVKIISKMAELTYTVTDLPITSEISPLFSLFYHTDASALQKLAALSDELIKESETFSDRIYNDLNNGVYRSGFATQQSEHESAAIAVRDCLIYLDELLGTRKFLLGDFVSENDVFLLPTIERFDSVYRSLFRCTGISIAECPNILRWYKEMRQFPNVKETFDVRDSLRSYFEQLFPLNPSRIVPLLPKWQEDLLKEENELSS